MNTSPVIGRSRVQNVLDTLRTLREAHVDDSTIVDLMIKQLEAILTC